ncbi:ester cyclase [Cucumibacter marinus]|uniref:ester cyclase n=1 Tax=Cucumibacter marinus TaxID=1121252 RepID=UPI000420D274|nr:ester cyclase [Cucumibacter marinus]
MTINENKAVVTRFNREVIEKGDRAAFEALVAPDFVNHTALPGAERGPEGLWTTFETILRPAIPDLCVDIHDMVGEGEKVVTRKSLTGRLTGPLMGAAPTGEPVRIEVIDIVIVRDGRYAEHWSVNTIGALVAQLKAHTR